MNKKLLTVLMVIAVVCSLSIVSADGNDTNATDEVSQELDLSQYITASQISNGKVEFSDGFTGFLIDSNKNKASSSDGFTANPTSVSDLGKYLKSAIVECYKQDCEDRISEVMESFADGSYKNSADPVIKEAVSSNENIGDSAEVKINNDTEATFTFEILKPANNETSEYIAYKVSLKTVESEDKLSAGDDENASSDADKSSGDETQDTEKTNDSSDKNQDTEKSSDSSDKNAAKSEDDKKSDTQKPDTSENSEKTEPSKNTTEPKDNGTEIHEKNKTIINKTNTVIVNQKNITIINQTTVKHINNTTNNDTPQNDTNSILMQAAGNPITILIIVALIIAVVGVVYSRKD